MTDTESKPRTAKPFWIGCGVVCLAMVLCAGGLVYLGGRGIRAFQQGFEQAYEDESFAQQWHVPAADVTPEALAPDSVAGFQLESTDENARFPALGIEHDGTHAVYRKENDTIDVAVYRMSETDNAAVFDEVLRRIDDDDRFRSHSQFRTTRSLRFSVDPPPMNGVFWHADGWQIFVRSQTVTELDSFLKAYLTTIAAEDGVGPETQESE